MCSIGGWHGLGVSYEDKQRLFECGRTRGRDGFGAWTDYGEVRSLETRHISTEIFGARTCLFNFRGAPTTEAVSLANRLQPYRGMVHNGTVANAGDYGEFPIDSMALPYMFEDRRPEMLAHNCAKIKGGYALAYAYDGGIVVAANYKPVYYYASGTRFIFGSTAEMVGNLRAVQMPAYTGLYYKNGRLSTFELRTDRPNNKVLVSCSAGLDSTTVAYMLKAQGFDVTLVYFFYGCNAQEREFMRLVEIADHGNFKLQKMVLPDVFAGSIVNGTYSTDQKQAVRYANDWVSARNLLMLATLTAYAETNQFNWLAYGGNLEESGAYPDNEQQFGNIFNQLLNYSVQANYRLQLLQPLAHLMKHEIVKEGIGLGVPYELTWSCYGGGQYHCGKCGPCYMRRVAFERNGLVDPIKYGI